jgi:ATP-dependent helicase YprA (DUF1998 family)/very-short-patch-repair endonuclease
MEVFDLRDRLVADYRDYTQSFIKIGDPRIKEFVGESLEAGAFWPEPLLQLNPTFQPGGLIDELTADGTLHKESSKIFRIGKTDNDHDGKPLQLHFHQREAIQKYRDNQSYVLTSGTGSGKSLTYIVPVVDHVLRRGSGKGIQAIVVYPMNALANSQDDELKKFLEKGYPEGSPVSFARYTGQERGEKREAIRANPPDILLTNYMMLELLLTRPDDREIVRAAQGLRFLVFDELHTYRGRQGADVALLIRRCRQAFAGGDDVIHIGTSATMASGGTTEDQKAEVAKVATTLFGVPFDSSQIIGETLERATPEVDVADPATVEAIRKAIEAGGEPPSDYEEFRTHPLASWIETTFGVQKEERTDRLIRQAPRRLKGEELEGQKSAAVELAELTGADPDQCAIVLRRFLIKGSKLRRDPSNRYPIFAFRLHQFFTRGDTVWTTLESEADRHLEMAKKVTKPGDPDKPLYPLAFCRHCGTGYYRVKVVPDGDAQKLIPREDRREKDDDGTGDAYLHLSSEAPWPRTTDAALLDRLPDFMKEATADGGERVKSDERKNLPEPVYVDATGRIVGEEGGIAAALIHRNFLFCLNPECGVAWPKIQKSERGKLATLGVDTRSTATTILAIRSLIELQGDRDLSPEARKLLSFTDNRQDASLQAGHFNDFSQVTLLRSALYRAAAATGELGLRHADLSRCVFEAAQLGFDEYAADPNLRGPARAATDDALRRVIDYYLYRDLQRDWRMRVPNLEDCGLLWFDFEGLEGNDGLLEEKELWDTGFNYRVGREDQFLEVPEPLRSCPTEIREELLRTLLYVMRRQLAVKADVLNPQKHLDLIEQTHPRINDSSFWYLEDVRDLVKAEVAYPRPKRRRERRGFFVSSYGGYGRYVKRRIASFIDPDQPFGRPQVDQIIGFLFEALKRYGIVEQVRSGQDEPDPGYQINPDAMRWMPGDGSVKPIDKTRVLEDGEMPPEVNQYFKAVYETFVDLKCVLEAREHTAQVKAEDREEREERFRSGNLPLLFCSPTMELGVDIAQLNLVNLRNVPPTPANYAQRSGRAGRGGQPALVFTYCAGRSPHDQFFFREPGKMVGGVVAPPRIDLRNRDLVRSHLNAIWLESSQVNLGTTLTNVIDLTHNDGEIPLPVKDEIRAELNSPRHRAAAMQKARVLVDSIREYLADAPWYHDDWAEEVLAQTERSFDRACDRWRSLYRSAVRQREIHHKIIGDHARPDHERKQSRRLYAQANSALDLLTQAAGVYEGDFYSYRYFAAEGFLPGYNFPRLPLSAYVPGRGRRRGRDEYVSRPRFLAISEFGPGALIYHEGARYMVYRVNLDYGTDDIEGTHELVTQTNKRCESCGYAHVDNGDLAEVCDRCGARLEVSSRIDHLVQLQNVSLRLAQRITCDEEERQRFGYQILSSYRFPEVGGRLDRKDAEVLCGETRVMSLNYGDATDLYRINMGWSNLRGDQPPGFNLDLEKGMWARNPGEAADGDDPTQDGRIQRVVPYVRDTKNTLVMKLEPARSNGEMAALQAAFKEAIQKFFQLESREISCEPMPSSDDRREILFYESSEGGAGVLRQIAEDPTVLPQLARIALELCHFDPDTLEDQAAETCGKACYSCLLDYGNQRDHQHLDRFEIRDLLNELSGSVCRPAGGTGSRAERVLALRKRCDSKLEERWLDMVDKLALRLPSDAQYRVPNVYTQADFYYEAYNAVIYIDGPPHDQPDQIRDDETKTRDLQELGYIVVRFHHKADWDEIFRRHPDIFGTPQT